MLNASVEDIELEHQALPWKTNAGSRECARRRQSYLRKFSDPWEQTAQSPFESKAEKAHKTAHYTERAHTVFRDPMVRSDQVIPGNLIFRDDSRAVCTGGHHIHIRYRFAPAAAARVLDSCVHLTWDTRALPTRASSHSMCSFIPFSQWQMSCWNQPEIANVLWYWPPENVFRALPKLHSSRNKPNSLNFLLIIMWNFYFDINAFLQKQSNI